MVPSLSLRVYAAAQVDTHCHMPVGAPRGSLAGLPYALA